MPKKLLVTFHNLKWPWQHGERSLAAIFWLRVSGLPATQRLRVFLMFFPKKHLSFFSHWLIMERSQNWPDLESRISKFWDIHFIDTGTDINCWKFQGDQAFSVAMRSIQTFFWGEVSWHDLVTWPWVLGLKFYNMCGKDYEQLYQKQQHCAPPFF